MTVDAATLAAYVGTDPARTGLEADLEEALALVTRFNRVRGEDGTFGPSAAPESAVDDAVLQVAAGLFDRRTAPTGAVQEQYGTADGVGSSPVRIARDPLAPAYKILRPWVPQW